MNHQIRIGVKALASNIWDVVRFYFPAFLVSIVFTMASLIALKGAFIHPELYERIPHLISSKPLISRIFDSRVMDYDMYQARELSYLGDQIDAAAIFEMIQRGMPNMISIMHYLLGTLAVILLYGFCRKDLALGKVVSLAMAAIAWSTPCMFLGGNYFRTAKIGTAVCLASVIIVTYRLLGKIRIGKPIHVGSCGILGALTLLMTLWDRQGFYMALCLSVLLALMGIITRQKQITALLFPVMSAIAASTIYNLFVAPWITHALNGYWPDFSYQRLPWHEILDHLPVLLFDGAKLLGEEIIFALGNAMAWVAGAVFLVASMMVWPSNARIMHTAAESRYAIAALLGLAVTAIFMVSVMNALMLARQPGIYIPVYRYTYYPLPVTFLWLLLFGLALSKIRSILPSSAWPPAAICLMILAGNLIALPGLHRGYFTQYLKHFIDPSIVFYNGLREVHAGRSPSEESLCHDVLFRILSHRMHHDLPEVKTAIKYIPY